MTRPYPTINKKSFTSASHQYGHKTFSQRGKTQMDDLVSIVNPQYVLLPSAGLNISEYWTLSISLWIYALSIHDVLLRKTHSFRVTSRVEYVPSICALYDDLLCKYILCNILLLLPCIQFSKSSILAIWSLLKV